MAMTHQHILLEKFTENDFEDYVKLVTNFEVMKMITERSLSREEAQQDFAKILIQNTLHPVLGTYKVISSANTFLGFAKLEIQRSNAIDAELGYMLMPEHWGKGLGTQIAEELIQLARQNVQLQRLYAIIDPKNSASRKILIKQGFYSKDFKDFDGLDGEILELNLKETA